VIIYKKYGQIVEITQTEKTPSQVRLRVAQKRRDVFGARRPDSLRRTRQIVVRRVSSALEEYGCPLLVTFTFNGDASDAAGASRSLRVFQVRVRDKYPNAQSLFVPELSPKGRIHFHGLLFNVPMHLGDIRKGGRTISRGTERQTRELAAIWGEGYVDAEQTDGSGKLAYYISKYLTKAGGEVMFNAMHMLRISQGFPKEVVFRGAFAEHLKELYSKRTPDKVWESDHLFLGKLVKRTYYDK